MKAIITISRRWPSKTCTVGELSLNGKFFCYTLEDVVRGLKEAKVFGATAIPAGTYSVILNTSTRFRKLMPLVLNVPGFEGIRLHPGNTDKDTLGCLLVGYDKLPSNLKIYRSQPAYEDLMSQLIHATAIELTIR